MQEFKEFAMKGNVVDLAVGVIVGAAFSKIVEFAVSDALANGHGRGAGKGGRLVRGFRPGLQSPQHALHVLVVVGHQHVLLAGHVGEAAEHAVDAF
eukprot:gene3780-5408_t